MTQRELVLEATRQLFDERDLSATDRYWSSQYIEHSTIGGPGIAGLREVASGLPNAFRHERIRVLSEGDLVFAHGLYHGIEPEPAAACDLWRVNDGKIVEHWNAQQPFVAKNPSGHSMTDGAVDVLDRDKTAVNKQLVEEFVQLIMMGADRSQLPRFFDGNAFTQHNPLIADGVSGLGTAIQTGVWAAVVEKCHRVVAEGNFVFTLGEGVLEGRPAAFYDLFRVDDDRLTEHWDVVFAQPPTLPHGNGLF